MLNYISICSLRRTFVCTKPFIWTSVLCPSVVLQREEAIFWLHHMPQFWKRVVLLFVKWREVALNFSG